MPIRRQTIVDNIVTRFKTILISGGFHTDLGNNVFKWRSVKLEGGDLPAAIVRDVSDDPGTPRTEGTDAHLLSVEVELVVALGSDDDEVRKMIADIYQAIGNDERWTGEARSTIWGGDELLVEQNERLISGAIARFQVDYLTKRFTET